jgi:hypothetical protein
VSGKGSKVRFGSNRQVRSERLRSPTSTSLDFILRDNVLEVAVGLA